MPWAFLYKDGTYFEGDIIREKNPNYYCPVLSAKNNQAKRAQGQLGNDLMKHEQ
jgi:uncharacterized protein (UPF0305 family)